MQTVISLLVVCTVALGGPRLLYLRSGRRTLLWNLGLAMAVALLSFIPLLGLPGAVAMLLSTPWFLLFTGAEPETVFAGDKAWPAAILISFLLPAVFPLAYYLGGRFSGERQRFKKWAIAALVFLLWASICPFFVTGVQ